MDLLYANDRTGAYPESYYAASARPAPPRPALEGRVRADVCVIGAGYTGLSAALHLAQAGLDVVLLEAHRAGWGASGRNGGQLGSGMRKDQPELERLFGLDRARALWTLGQDAKALVRDLIARHEIDCDLRDGVSYTQLRPGNEADQRRHVAHMAERYGYDALDFLDRDAVVAAVGSTAYRCGVLDREAAHLHPLNFALGLARAAEAAGVRICENSKVTELSDGVAPRVSTAHGSVDAEHVILACNGYLGGLEPDVSARVMPINNFIIATEPLGARAPEILPGNIAVADSKFVVNYFRLSADRRLLFGGGETYSYRFPADIRAFVRRPMLEIFPQLRDVRIDHGWGGTLGITRSRLPCLRRVSPRSLSASGYSGHGLGLATLSGRLMADAVRGEASGFDTLAAIPAPPFPGGAALSWPLLVLAMSWYALRDRLG